MNLRELLEEFKDGFKIKDYYVEVFVNPSSKEMNDASKKGCVRFIADPKSKKVYVFSPLALHNDVSKKLKFGKWQVASKENMWGVAWKVGRKWILSSSDSFKSLGDKRATTWEWMKKYVDFSTARNKVSQTWDMDDNMDALPSVIKGKE